jgi:hypothetical protein
MDETGERHLLVLDDNRALGLTPVAMAPAGGLEARAASGARDLQERRDDCPPPHVASALIVPGPAGIDVAWFDCACARAGQFDASIMPLVRRLVRAR